jgi:hypothetical protein
MKASLWGALLIGPAKYFWVLGRFYHETFPRSACLGWLCQTIAAMQDIWMSLHSIRSRFTYFHGFLSNSSGHHNFSYDVIDNFFTRRTFQDLAGYPRILGIIDLRPLRAMLPASMLGDYSTSASTPSCFHRRTDLLGNLFLITSLLDLLFFFFFGPSYRSSYPPRCSDTTHECIFDAL